VIFNVRLSTPQPMVHAATRSAPQATDAVASA
jgi:hypothetical protein